MEKSDVAKCMIREAQLRKLLGLSVNKAMALIFQTLDRAGISTKCPELITFERRGNDAFFVGPPHDS